MRFYGTRRARIVIILSTLLLLVGMWRVSRLYVAHLQRSLVPTILARLRVALERDIRVDRLRIDQPGLVVAEGIRVARGKSFAEGTFLEARRLELRYDPLLIGWSSLLSRAAGQDTRVRVLLSGVRVPQPGGLGDFATVESADTTLDIGPALRGQVDQVLGTVDRVHVRRALLRLVRSREGRWNYTDVLKLPKSKRPSPFRGEIVLAQSSVELYDFHSGGLPAPARNRADGSGIVRFAGFPRLQWSATGRLRGPQGGPFRVHGTQHTSTKSWFVSLDADSDDLRYWYHYVVTDRHALELLRGRGHARLLAWGEVAEPPVPPRYSLELEVASADARLPALKQPLRSFRGQVTVDPAFLTVDGTTRLEDAPVRVSADVLRGPMMRAELRLSSSALTLPGLRRVFPALRVPGDVNLPGRIAAEAVVLANGNTWTVRGSGSTPEVRYRDAGLRRVAASFRAQVRDGALQALSAHVRSADGHLRDLTGNAVIADVRTRGDVVDISARFSSMGATITGHGWIGMGEVPEFYAAGELTNLDLAQVPWKIEHPPRVSGTVSGTFVAAGTTEAPRIEASIQGNALAFEAERLETVAARVHWADDVLTIPRATIRDERGQIALSGTVRNAAELDLHASADGISLEGLLAGRLEQELRGTAYLSAHVTGTVDRPQLQGKVQVYRPAFGDHSADYLEAGIQATGLDEFELSSVKLTRVPAEATAERLVLRRPQPSGPWEVEGTVQVEGLTLVQALRTAGVDLEGLRRTPVAGDFGPLRLTVSGEVSSPRVRFSATAASVAALGLDLGEVSASGEVDLGARQVRLEAATARSDLGALDARGTIAWRPADPESDVAVETAADLQVEVSGVRLRPLLRRYVPRLAEFVRVEGAVASVSGAVTGDLRQPSVSAGVEVTGLILNERAVQVEPFRVDWSASAVLVRDFAARLGSGRLRVPYLAALNEDTVQEWPLPRRLLGSIAVEHVPFGVARQLLEDSPYFRTDSADSLRETLSLWRSPLGGDISAVVRIDPEEGTLPDTVTAAARLIRLRQDAPTVTASVTIPNLVSPPGSDQPPTQLSVLAAYRNDRFDLREFRLEQEGGALVTATGYYDHSVPKQPAQVRLSARASAVPLKSLSRLPVADVRERLEQVQPLDGLLQLQAEVTGTDKAPHAEFGIDIERPVLYGVPFDRFRLTNGEYDGAQGELRVAEARIIRDLENGSAGVLFSGTMPLTWPQLAVPRNAPRQLVIDVPEQSLEVFSLLATDAEVYAATEGAAPSEKVRTLVSIFRQVAATEGRMQGKLTLGGTAIQPRNTGGVGLMGATLRIDGLQTVIRDFNARLEFAGDLVRLAEFRGESSEGGRFTGGGAIRLARDINGQPMPILDLSLGVRGFRFAEKQVGSLLGDSFAGTQFSGTLDTVSISSPEQLRALTIRGPWPTPLVEGGVRLDDATLLLAYEDRGLPEEPKNPPQIRMNVRFFAGKNVWLRNPQLRLKIGGSVLASNSTAEPVLTGDLPVTQGSMQLAGLRLRNAEGVIRIAYDRRNRELGVTPPPPVYVDLAASTSLRVVRAAGDEAEYYETTFEIRGALGARESAGVRPAGVGSGLSVGSESGLTLTVRTDPPLPSREIEALIRQQFGVEGFSGSGANVVEALRGQIEQAFAVNVTSAFTGRLEETLQSALGLSTLSLDLGFTQPLRVRLGKRLFGPVYGTVSQEFGSGNSQRQFELYYRINPQLRIGFRQEDPPNRRVIFFSGTATF